MLRTDFAISPIDLQIYFWCCRFVLPGNSLNFLSLDFFICRMQIILPSLVPIKIKWENALSESLAHVQYVVRDSTISIK